MRGIATDYGGSLCVVLRVLCTKESFGWCNNIPPRFLEHAFTRACFPAAAWEGSSADDTRHSVTRRCNTGSGGEGKVGPAASIPAKENRNEVFSEVLEVSSISDRWVL